MLDTNAQINFALHRCQTAGAQFFRRVPHPFAFLAKGWDSKVASRVGFGLCEAALRAFGRVEYRHNFRPML
jgi:hypothetical protein